MMLVTCSSASWLDRISAPPPMFFLLAVPGGGVVEKTEQIAGTARANRAWVGPSLPEPRRARFSRVTYNCDDVPLPNIFSFHKLLMRADDAEWPVAYRACGTLCAPQRDCSRHTVCTNRLATGRVYL